MAWTACSSLNTPATLSTPVPTQPAIAYADITRVAIGGDPGAYRFSVTVSSPDTGCDSYADWWEIVSDEGDWLGRRIFLHSHGDEQPFSRSGGPFDIQPDDIVIVRAHMNDAGFGGVAFRGSIADGLAAAELPDGFAAAVEKLEPQPSDCGG